MGSKALNRAVGKIKLVLAQKEMGEKDLAKEIGLTADEVSQLLTRVRKLEFKTLEDIATALGVLSGQSWKRLKESKSLSSPSS